MKPSEIMLDLGRPVAYYPGLAKKVGGVKAAVFLSQILYWTGKQEDEDGYIFKDSDSIEDETGMSYDEQKTARRHLKTTGVLLEKEDRLNHKLGFKIELLKLDSLFPEHGNATSGNVRKPRPLKGTTENTSENTFKIKDLTHQQKMVGSLAKVLNGNSQLMGSRLGRLASAMIKVGATAEKVEEMYSKGSWWYLHHWKGQKGQYPNETDIRNTWDHWDVPVAPRKGLTADDIRAAGL